MRRVSPLESSPRLGRTASGTELPGAGPAADQAATSERASALYVGRVAHVRHAPRPRSFGYSLFLCYLDLDELDGLFDGAWLWSHERFNVASFRRKHYLGDPEVPLREAVRERVARALGESPPDGPVRVLTHPAFLGYCFNPVSFYYLFEKDGRTLHSITAEITNTPWRERFQYVLPASTARRRGELLDWSFDKEFHVSPFFDMDHRYEWTFSVPGPRLEVAMTNFAPDVRGAAFAGSDGEPGRVFDASLALDRRPFEPAQLRRCLARHPFMTRKVQFAIHWQALRLWLRRTPFFAHPRLRTPA